MAHIFKDFEQTIINLLPAVFPGVDLATDKMTVEPPRESSHGDLASNAAMVLTKQLSLPPREVAEKLKPALEKLESVEVVSIAGPGFLNLTLKPDFWDEQLKTILLKSETYGVQNIGQGQKVNVEYVSTNPTGPVHLGHLRGAILGDVFANMLEFVGYSVTREYYINDGGQQVDVLARSVHKRYLEALGEDIGEIPSGLYPGDYLIPVGKELAKKYGDRFKTEDESAWLSTFRSFAVEKMMSRIREDLKELGIQHDHFASERAIMESEMIPTALQKLDKDGHLYVGTLPPPRGIDVKPEEWESKPLTLFKSSAFGDDQDRPVMREDGSHTYFCNDIAYHLDKIQRSGDYLVLVLGLDHAGYAKRIKAVVTALTQGKTRFEVIFNDIMKVLKDGQPVKLSKRAGNIETVRDMIEAVGKDVLRFVLLTRKHDQPIELDINKVKEQTRENPVFYVQYAHARICSVFRHAADMFPDLDLSSLNLAKADLRLLREPLEQHVIKTMCHFPRHIEMAVQAREPHRLAFYVLELAGAFHSLWNEGTRDASLRFLHEENRELTAARLALVKGVQIVIGLCFRIFGVTALERLESEPVTHKEAL